MEKGKKTLNAKSELTYQLKFSYFQSKQLKLLTSQEEETRHWHISLWSHYDIIYKLFKVQ